MSVDTTPTSSWLELVSSLCLLLLQLGLHLLEAGSVRSKNVSSVMMRGLSSLALTITASWVCGYCFAWSNGGPVLGSDPAYLVLTNLPTSRQSHFLQYCGLACLPPAIMSGSMSERSHITGHLVISLLLSLIIFPAPAHWLWHSEGWLATRGCSDQSGPIAIHLLSGWAALLGALIVGPRLERMGDNFREVSLPGHSLPLTAIGATLVILGMVGKVVGVNHPQIAGLVALNSLVSGAAGCLATMTIFKLKTRRRQSYSLSQGQQASSTSQWLSLSNRKWSYFTAFNGFFTGMISVSGAGADLPSWAAFIAGITGALMFFLISGLLRLNKVDDPVHGVSVHLSGGLVGAFLVGLLNLAETRDGMSVAWQVVGIVSVSAWSCACLLVLLLPLLLCGKLRVKDFQEKAGIDEAKMKEPAYMISSPVRETTVHYLDRSQPCTFLQPSPRTLKFAGDLSSVHGDGLSPKLFSQQPPPSPPPLPSYPTSTLKRDFNSHSSHIPEVTITSCDSQAPLISSKSSSRQLRETLRQQRSNLRTTNSVFTVRECPYEDISSSSVCSNSSVRSSVVRQVDNNKDNFNYLLSATQKQDTLDTEEIGDDTEIDITKYLKSPGPETTKTDLQKTSPKLDGQDTVENNKRDKLPNACIDFNDDEDGREVVENLI